MEYKKPGYVLGFLKVNFQKSHFTGSNVSRMNFEKCRKNLERVDEKRYFSVGDDEFIK